MTTTYTVNSAGVTLIPFTVTYNQLFTFTAVLTDSSGNQNTYVFTTPWNIFGQRFYVTCTDQQNNHIFTVPMIGSPDIFDIPLTAGYFSTSVLYRTSTGNFEVSDVALTGSKPGINLAGGQLIARPAVPDGFDFTTVLNLDGTWELDGTYELGGTRSAATGTEESQS